jgi:hypothetical protein
LQISVTTTLVPYDSRTFSPWLRTYNEILTFEKDEAGERKVVVSQGINMTDGSVVDIVPKPISTTVATSGIAFAPGSRTVTIYTVPATPTGNGRFVLTRCIVRLARALVGTGNITFKIGSTSGGEQIILSLVVNNSTTTTVLAGEAIASLGSDMLATNAYEVVYNAGQQIYASLVMAGIVTDGQIDVYLYGVILS